jgi:hypothetical protein
MGLLDEIKPLSEQTHYIKLVLSGPAGTGKTTLCAEAEDPIWCDFERSTEVLRKLNPDLKVFRPKRGFQDVLRFTREALKVHKTLVYDTITSMQIFYMREYMARTVEEAKRRNSNSDRSIYLPYQGDFRYATNELTEFFLMLQEADNNIIFVAHSKDYYAKGIDGSDKLIATRPHISPALWDNLEAFVNVVAHYVKIGDKRRMYLNPTGVIHAKNRLGITEPYVDNPKLKELFNV